MDKAPMFMVGIVGLVALIGVVIMISNSPGLSSGTITANVALDSGPVDFSGFGIFLFIASMIGAAVYLYRHE